MVHQQKEARSMEAEERMRKRDIERLETGYLLDKIDLMQRDIDLQYRTQQRTREANNIILGGISTVSAVLGGFVMASLVEAPLENSNDSFVPVVRFLCFAWGLVLSFSSLLFSLRNCCSIPLRESSRLLVEARNDSRLCCC